MQHLFDIAASNLCFWLIFYNNQKPIIVIVIYTSKISIIDRSADGLMRCCIEL